MQIYVTFCEHIFSAYSCNNVSYSLCLPTIAQFIERFMHSLENEQTDCFLRMQIMKGKCHVILSNTILKLKYDINEYFFI